MILEYDFVVLDKSCYEKSDFIFNNFHNSFLWYFFANHIIIII